MEKGPEYLKCYAAQYRVVKREDGNCYIQTLHPDKDGMTFDVYSYSDTDLAASLPPRAAGALMKRYPEIFRVHQIADDAVVLVFSETELIGLAGALKLRKRRQLSVQQTQIQTERLSEYQFQPQVRGGFRVENRRSRPRSMSTPRRKRSVVLDQ